MKLRKITLLGVLSLFVFNQEAKSVEFSDKVYGKAYFNVGYAIDLFKSKKIEKFIDD